MPAHHALVLGASGITGWAIVNQLLTDDPDAQHFTKITALTNRPLSDNVSKWPNNPKLNTASGVDLLSGTQVQLEANLQSAIVDIHTVTHVFFNGWYTPTKITCIRHTNKSFPPAYKFSPDMKEQSVKNADMLERCVTAAENLCPEFKFIVLPTGGKVCIGYTIGIK